MQISRRISPIYIFYLLCFLCLFTEWMMFTSMIGGIGNSVAATIVKGVGDCAMLLILYWILPEKYKGLNILIIWLASFFFIANIWYYRFWGNFISPTFYRLSSNLNQDLINSVKGLIRLTDALFIVLPLILTLCYFLFFRKKLRNNKLKQSILASRGTNMIMICLSSAAFLISQVAFNITAQKWSKAAGYGDPKFSEILASRFTFDHTPIVADYKTSGLSVYWLKSLVEVVSDLSTDKDITLNENEIQSIRHFLEKIPESPEIEEFKHNTAKNLIIIITESLNADVIDREINGHALTPFMNSLLRSEGTVAALNIIPQVKEGCSNDGQLLTNTGLLPLSKGISSMLFDDEKTYPKLSEILHRPDGTAIFGDNGNTWNQLAAFKSYGFTDIFTLTDFEEAAGKIGRDKAMFEYAEEIIPKLKMPFLLEFVTISMHVPFREEAVPLKEWIKNSDISQNEMNYLNMVNYFDGALSEFIGYLKRKNLYDNSVIIIVSDHTQELTTRAMGHNEGTAQNSKLPMLFMAVNTGYTQTRTVVAGQVNIFPTILQIMNRYRGNYHGLGRSLLDPGLKTAITTDGKLIGDADATTIRNQTRAFAVSDSIIRGGYFKVTKR